MSQIGSINSTLPPGSGVASAGDSPIQAEPTTRRQGESPPRRETLAETAMTDSRMQAMRAAIQRSGGILLLDQFCIDTAKLGRKPLSSKESRAQKKIVGQVAVVKKAFDQLDALDPAALKKVTLDRKTSKVVENAFKQLNTLDERLAALEKIAGTSIASQNLRDACMARLCELSRFVGALQAEAMTDEERRKSGIHGFEPLKPGGSVRDMLSDLAVAMHGNDQATRGVSGEAERLFNEVRALKAGLKNLAPQDIARAAATLRERAVALGRMVDDILAPPAPGQSKSMPGEPALFRAIGDYVGTAIADMESLIRQSPRDTISPLLREAFPDVDASLLAQCKGLPSSLNVFLGRFQGEINTRHTELSQKFTNGSLTGAEVLAASGARDGAVSTRDAMLARATLRIMKGVMDGTCTSKRAAGRILIEEMTSRITEAENRSGKNAADEARKQLQQTAAALLEAIRPLRKIPRAEREPYVRLYEQFMRTSLLLRSPAASRDALEIADAVDRSKNPVPVERYFPLLFEQRARLSTLIAAAMYNIAPEHLEVRPDSGQALSSKVLGQGAVNTVRLCRYTDDHGRPFDLVFKPESPARAGLEGLRIARLGYGESIRAAHLNMASSTVAGLLGTPQVLASSSLGFYDGTPGLFMSHAPGKTPYDLITSGELQDIGYQLRKNGKLEIMSGNLQRELCRLEWADLLSGQADRHALNYLVDINPEDGSVTVTGIDNDGSFGERMTGITTVDLTNALDAGDLAVLKQRCREGGGQSPPYELQGGKVLVHFEKVTSLGGYEELHTLLGMNQMFFPAHIDKTTYDNLMALDADGYRASLGPFLSPAALNAAVLRLESAKKHARALMAQKDGCLQDDGWRMPGLLTEACAAAVSPRHQGVGEVGLEFFARDFAGRF